MLLLEAERPGHTAASGIERGGLEAGNELQHRGRTALRPQCLLVTVAVDEARTRPRSEVEPAAPCRYLMQQPLVRQLRRGRDPPRCRSRCQLGPLVLQSQQ